MIKQRDHITIILDDDPTGTQTVDDTTVLTDWSHELLLKQFDTDENAFFILTNTRAFAPEEAKAMIAEICENIHKAAFATNKKIAVILRGDSTLRSHFPLEAETVESVLGKADKWIICPFFLEGNRVTKNDIHYLIENGEYIPVAETVFAKDVAFGYVSSNLKEWIVEKSKGRFSLDDITSIEGESILEQGEAYVQKCLAFNAKLVIINAETFEQVNIVANVCKALEEKNKTFIYCTAASFVQAYLQKEKRLPLKPHALIKKENKNRRGGLIIVGSYVAKTTQQLQQLFLLPGLLQIEISVAAIIKEKISILSVAKTINSAIGDGKTVVLFTSRKLIASNAVANNLSLGKLVSGTLVSIMQQLNIEPAYLISKGGITSSDIATKGLGIKKATVLGQAFAGVPVWQTGNESKFPGMRYIIFPGNVGDEHALANMVAGLEKANNTKNLSITW